VACRGNTGSAILPCPIPHHRPLRTGFADQRRGSDNPANPA
jgi:hypothetical protein